MKRDTMVVKHDVVVNVVRPTESLFAWQFDPSMLAWPLWIIPYLSFAAEPSVAGEGPRKRPRFLAVSWARFHGMVGVEIADGDWFVLTAQLLDQPIAKYSNDDFHRRYTFETMLVDDR